MIKSLSSLRFIFIIFIFLHHSKGYVGGGTMGVAFFFVLGGFCMVLGYKDKIIVGGYDYGKYLARRAIKFYPLHWICLLTVVLLSTFHIHQPLDVSKALVFISNFALLHTWIPLEEFYFSYNSVSWYLADTMFFAFIFPALLKFIMKTHHWGRVCMFLLFISYYVIAVACVPSDNWHSILYISPYIRLTDFVFGIVLAILYNKIKDSQRVKNFFKYGNLNFLMILTLIGLLIYESVIMRDYQFIAPVYWPLIAFLILITSLSDCSKGLFSLFEKKFFVQLGKCSFTFFMIHTIILKYIHLVFYGSLFFYFTLTIICSLIIDRFVLPTITQWLTKNTQLSMTVRS